jgi:hypothetical protein
MDTQNVRFGNLEGKDHLGETICILRDIVLVRGFEINADYNGLM